MNIKITESIHGCLVTIDGEPVGLIQSLKVELDVQQTTPHVEITFPDLREFQDSPKGTSIKSMLAENLERLHDIPFVELKFKELTPTESPTVETPVQTWASTTDVIDGDPADLAKWDVLWEASPNKKV